MDNNANMVDIIEVMEAPFNPVQQYREFFGKGAFKYAVYPDYWPREWGKPPMLGIVNADNEFYAERIAYDKGILPTHFNCTFGPKFKNLGPTEVSKKY